MQRMTDLTTRTAEDANFLLRAGLATRDDALLYVAAWNAAKHSTRATLASVRTDLGFDCPVILIVDLPESL
jgi:hypothetical protein